MHTYFDCIPCFLRQGLDAVRLITDDPLIQEQVLREICQLTSKMDFYQSPPAMAQKMHRIIRQLTENADPYSQVKKQFTDFALSLFPKYHKCLVESKKPFEVAVRLAIAANIIDFGAKSSLDISEVEKTIEECLFAPFDMTDFEDFQEATSKAKDILYLADNAGEIVFDRMLIELIGPEKVTLVVKGGPIINDATREDVRDAGLTDLVEVIDNGDDAPGTILESCSEGFKCRFKEADLVISKGQGNYETLSDVDKDMYFILKAKCPVIARGLNCEVGAPILKKKIKTKTASIA